MNILIIVAFMVVIAGLAYLSLGIGAALTGYTLLKVTAKFGSTPAPKPWEVVPNPQVWTYEYSSVSGPLPLDADGNPYIDFPTRDGIHYVIKSAPSLQLGQTLTMKFTLAGEGELVVADPTDIPPATVRLHIAGKNNINDRWWGDVVTNLDRNGDFSVSVPVDPAHWTGVGGNPPVVQAPFASILSSCLIGWTLGGQWFAGHGIYVKGGGRKFTLKSYTVA